MPITLNPDQRRRYRALRHDGVPAVNAYHDILARQPELPYRTGPGEAITFTLDDPKLAGFVVTATACPDPNPDLSWLGHFTDRWCPDAIEVNRDPRYYRYFVPECTIAARRADLSSRGYARGVAYELAERQSRADARLATELEHAIVTVSVRKAGVLLGTAGAATNLPPETTLEDAIVDTVAEANLIDDAVDQARAELPRLVNALSA